MAWAAPDDDDPPETEPPETEPPLSEPPDEPELEPEPEPLDVPVECAADEAVLPELACAGPGRTEARPAVATALATATPVVIADSRRRPRRRNAAGDAGRLGNGAGTRPGKVWGIVTPFSSQAARAVSEPPGTTDDAGPSANGPLAFL